MASGSLNELFPAGHPALRRMASKYLRHERRGHGIDPAALVNDAFVALSEHQRAGWDGLAHVVGAASIAMRRILVDGARTRSRTKHGAGVLTAMPEYEIAAPPTLEGDAVREAIGDPRRTHPALARVVELRCHGGLSVEEAAVVLGVSPTSVRRRWAEATGWLRAQLGGAGSRRLSRMRACP